MTFRFRGNWPGTSLAIAALMLSPTMIAAAQQESVSDQQRLKVIPQTQSLAPQGLASAPEPLGPLPVDGTLQLGDQNGQNRGGSGMLFPRVAAQPPAMQEGKAPAEFGPPPAAPLLYSQPTALMKSAHDSSIPAANASQRTYATPQLRIISQTPQDANIHHAGQFRFRVINDGPIKAQDVKLSIAISGQGRVRSTFPENGVQENDMILFQAGDMGVGQFRDFGFEFQPEQAGQIQVTPQVTCSSSVSVMTAVSAPKIDIEFSGEDEFLVGQQINQMIRIHNPGSDTVRNLVVRQTCTPSTSVVDAGFDGNRYIVPLLAPGQVAELSLQGMATQVGQASFKIDVEGDNVRGSAIRELSLVKNNLEISLDGPQLTYIHSVGTWSISIHNDQQRDMANLQVKLQLPIGMIVTVLDREAEFNSKTATITWNIPRLSAGQIESIPFKATISQFGSHTIEASINDITGTIDSTSMSTQAMGRADIELKVVTSPEPIETGSSTSVVIQVQNRGTNEASDVAVELLLPTGMKAADSDEYTLVDDKIRFEPFLLTAGQSREMTIPVNCDQAGDQVIRATVRSSASSKPMAAENSLFFFSSEMNRTADRSTNGR